MDEDRKSENYQIPQEPYIINEQFYYNQMPQKAKKKHKMFVKIMAVVLAVVIITGSTYGGYKLVSGLSNYIANKTGITLNNKSNNSANNDINNNSAFTINKVAEANNVQTTTNTNEKLTLQQVAQKVIPSVVCIQNLQSSVRNTAVQTAGEGSGIIMTSDGYIITNAHVVNGATSLKVITSDAKSYEAKLIGIDTSTDLALIKIEATDLKAAEFGDASQLQVADTVMAVGNPGGLEFNSSVTIGYVSALGRSIETAAGYTMHSIQTDAAINPGNSGGALVNMYGQVVGINSSKIVATGFEGLGFAITINEAQPIITDLKNYGYVKDRAMLGISYQMIDEMMAKFYRIKVGLYVQSINSDNVTKAGIEKGDVITQVEGKDITASTDLISILKTKKPGEKINLTVYKSKTNSTINADVVLSEYKGN